VTFPKKQRSSTQRGYNWDHRQARKHALANLIDGTPCHLCGHPMYRTQRLHLDHTPDRTTYRGLAHAQCNRVDGARRGAQVANKRQPERPRASQRW
jgi:hypothetical protein